MRLLHCSGDLAFHCVCPVTLEGLRLWAHLVLHVTLTTQNSIDFPAIIGTIAADRHLTHSAHVCFDGTEEDQTATT